MNDKVSKLVADFKLLSNEEKKMFINQIHPQGVLEQREYSEYGGKLSRVLGPISNGKCPLCGK